jgi:hypothetical protein
MKHLDLRSAWPWLAAALMVAGVRADGPDARLPKKLIATGWDQPNTQRLRQNLAAIEARPFDGTVIVMDGKDRQGALHSMVGVHGGDAWQRQWFQPCIDDLRACRFRRFTDNFLSIGANPGNVDWFDDAGWAEIVDHWRIAAWAARCSGVKGILFDPEPYSTPFAQFGYSAQSQHDRHTFDAYYAQARQRGREVMRAVAAEYPGITLFCYFIHSVNTTALGHRDPRRILETGGYGLYPAFVDGWLDVVPPSITIVDGCEPAYLYNTASEYVEMALRIKGACQELVSPENRAKYRAQVQAGFGMYLDAYWNPKGNPYYIDGRGGSRVERLRANASSALRAADGYVWVYGEQFRWWPTANGGVHRETWPEVLPGCDDALRFARDPLDFGRTRLAALKRTGKLENLAANGDFGAVTVTVEGRPAAWRPDGPPAGWGTWQEDSSHGTFTWDRQSGAAAPGSARVARVGGGCLVQTHSARPGQRYAVRAVRKLQGRGQAAIRVRWQTPEGTWIAESLDQIVDADGPRNQWSELFGVVEVPEGVGRLVILLGASGQASPQDVAWYDDVGLYRLP